MHKRIIVTALFLLGSAISSVFSQSYVFGHFRSFCDDGQVSIVFSNNLWRDSVSVVRDNQPIQDISFDSLRLNFDSIVGNNHDQMPRNRSLINVTFIELDEKSIDSIITSLDRNPYIYGICFVGCPIRKLPSSAKKLPRLVAIAFDGCDSIETLDGFNTVGYNFLLSFYDCKINHLPCGTENLCASLYLALEFPCEFEGFDLNRELKKFEKRKNITQLLIIHSKLDEFPEEIFKLTNLQSLIFLSNKNIKYPDRFSELPNLMCFVGSIEDSMKDSLRNKVQKCGLLNYFQAFDCNCYHQAFNIGKIVNRQYNYEYTK